MRRRAVVPALLALAMLTVAALAVGTPRLIGDTGKVWAHSGQLSPKDNCHNHRAAGERHWHNEGTAERGGACIKQDGIAYRVLETEAPPGPSDECEYMLKWLAGERPNSSGYFISRASDGDPLIVQSDATKLVRLCRGVPAQRE